MKVIFLEIWRLGKLACVFAIWLVIKTIYTVDMDILAARSGDPTAGGWPVSGLPLMESRALDLTALLKDVWNRMKLSLKTWRVQVLNRNREKPGLFNLGLMEQDGQEFSLLWVSVKKILAEKEFGLSYPI